MKTEWTAEEVQALVRELTVTWQMLIEALPLARHKLMAGGVDLLDQEAFWATYRDLEEFADCDEGDEQSPCGIMAHLDDLEKMLNDPHG